MSFKEMMQTDLEVFYNTEEFAHQALYKENQISVSFEKDYDVDSFREKRFRVRVSDTPTLKKGDIFQINSIDYKVLSFEPDDYELEYDVLVSKL